MRNSLFANRVQDGAAEPFALDIRQNLREHSRNRSLQIVSKSIHWLDFNILAFGLTSDKRRIVLGRVNPDDWMVDDPDVNWNAGVQNAELLKSLDGFNCRAIHIWDLQ